MSELLWLIIYMLLGLLVAGGTMIMYMYAIIHLIVTISPDLIKMALGKDIENNERH